MCHLVVIWDTVGVHLGIIWVSFRVIWVSFGYHLGVMWGSVGSDLEAIWVSFGVLVTLFWGPEMPVPCNTSAPWRQFLEVLKGMIYVFKAPLNISIIPLWLLPFSLCKLQCKIIKI